MKNCLFRIVIDEENQQTLDEIKNLFQNLPYTKDASFSPYIEHERYEGYIQLSITILMEEEYIEEILYKIADRWMIDDEDGDIEAETDWYESEIFHPHLYYILFQTL